MPDTPPIIDAIVIGRNEGARLVSCLNSLQGRVRRIIYVDSGSSDGSPEAARNAGAEVVDLDMSRPFTAARARNAGLARLNGADLVQFVDGDCSVDAGWIAYAAKHLANHAKLAVVCGRRREQYPEASIYNRLCDIEWNTPTGPALACGGDALMRVAAVNQVHGFREDLIAGEEPELCLRLRREGWGIERLDHEMTTHDAQILRFGQWWARSRRAGHAFAEGAYLHGRPPERHWVRETRRALFWGLGLPIVTLGIFAMVSFVAGLLLLLVYPAQVLRLAVKTNDWGLAVFSVLGKFPEALGVMQFHRNRLFGRKSAIVEYK
ncbi:MAG: glycosyltransferase [Rhodobacteraceae bacterium]|nr:glycosyltransferase [Paracoccaceae bacterium]